MKHMVKVLKILLIIIKHMLTVLKISLNFKRESDHWRLKWKSCMEEVLIELNPGDRKESTKERCEKRHS